MVEFVRILSEKIDLKLKKNISTIYSPKKEIIKKADTLSIDTELSMKLPGISQAFVGTKFEN